MRVEIGGFSLEAGRREKAAPGGDLITHFAPTNVGFWPWLREGFAGAWQRGVAVPIQDAATHPTFWTCLTLIAGDVAKCRPMLMQEADGVETETQSAAFSPVLRTPNHYQNRIQFLEYWILSKLSRGNTFALKERDERGVVTALYLLDPTRCRPLVTPSGDVYYQLGQDLLSGVSEQSTVVPAREIIHDRMNTLYHPLVGLSPVYACGHAALLGLKIMRNTEVFAESGSMIGGLLVAPGKISEQTAKRLEDHWNANYAGAENAGKVAAIGDGLKFEKPNIMSALDAQIIEQLKWGDEKVCATLHVPPYMAGVGPLPSYNNVEALGLQYYSQCLQILFESLELCLTEGLATSPYEVEMDISGLRRMDSVQAMEEATKGVLGGIYKPNEARARRGLKPVPGGDQVYLQKQNWPLTKLGSDDQPTAAPRPVAPEPAAVPMPAPEPAKALDRGRLLAAIARNLGRAA